MAWYLFGAKPLSETMLVYGYLDPLRWIPVSEIWIKIEQFLLMRMKIGA